MELKTTDTTIVRKINHQMIFAQFQEMCFFAFSFWLFLLRRDFIRFFPAGNGKKETDARQTARRDGAGNRPAIEAERAEHAGDKREHKADLKKDDGHLSSLMAAPPSWAATARERAASSSMESCSARAVGEIPASAQASCTASFGRPIRADTEFATVLRRWPNAARTRAKKARSSASTGGALRTEKRTTAESTFGCGMKLPRPHLKEKLRLGIILHSGAHGSAGTVPGGAHSRWAASFCTMTVSEETGSFSSSTRMITGDVM